MKIKFEIYNDPKVFTVGENGSRTTFQERTQINIGDKKLATSIANALRHAIKLCGGKPDPF